ncbi:hypothetical protein PGTUg99_015926 [Puccinia graminis f. sp. tritici]|uniref:Uncharacterized protein n=1 Tax=Puccinia graminis f. sp. tritici TaxID=56615 RepID=A0A5B0R4N4_PUCGR|nr:hypothetical protein PGTUg99_015926 [Puccinia graminis f. sp. tritici]
MKTADPNPKSPKTGLGDADIIGRHRLNLGCDSVPEVDSRESSPRVTPDSESNFKFKRHVQPKLNTTSIRWTRRSESDSPQVEHDINSLDSSLGGTDPIGIKRKDFLPSPGPISSRQLVRTPKNTKHPKKHRTPKNTEHPKTPLQCTSPPSSTGLHHHHQPPPANPPPTTLFQIHTLSQLYHHQVSFIYTSSPNYHSSSSASTTHKLSSTTQPSLNLH